MPHVGTAGHMDHVTSIPELKHPSVLVVEPPGFDVVGLSDELGSNGWSVETCAGPERIRCPLTTGGKCTLREEADIAVIFLGGRATSSTVVTPRVRCAASGCGTAVAVLEKSLDRPRIKGSFATIGAMQGPA